MVKHVSEIALQLRIALAGGAFNTGKRLGVVRGDAAAGQVHIAEPRERFVLAAGVMHPRKRIRQLVEGHALYWRRNEGDPDRCRLVIESVDRDRDRRAGIGAVVHDQLEGQNVRIRRRGEARDRRIRVAQ